MLLFLAPLVKRVRGVPDCGRSYLRTQFRSFSCGCRWSADPSNKHIHPRI